MKKELFIFYNILTALLILSFLSILQGQPTKDYNSCFEQLVHKYSGVTSISFRFKSTDMSDMRGKISAEKGNKYYLELLDRTIVCDSKTLWNFSKPDKKLIISNFEGDDNKESSIEQFFFNFLKSYKPVSLTEESSSRGKTSTVLKLIPSENKQGVKYLMLYLSKNYDIHSVSFFDGKKFQTWDVNDVVLNKKFPKNYFEFNPPENTTVIDLR